jgi:hypothetical protein
MHCFEACKSMQAPLPPRTGRTKSGIRGRLLALLRGIALVPVFLSISPSELQGT